MKTRGFYFSRKGERMGNRIEESAIIKMAQKDAKRWREAALDYGEGSRIRRQNLERELHRKRQNETYEEAFISAIAQLNDDDIFSSVRKKHQVHDTYKRAKKAYRTGKKIWNFIRDNFYLIDKLLND